MNRWDKMVFKICQKHSEVYNKEQGCPRCKKEREASDSFNEALQKRDEEMGRVKSKKEKKKFITVVRPKIPLEFDKSIINHKALELAKRLKYGHMPIIVDKVEKEERIETYEQIE